MLPSSTTLVSYRIPSFDTNDITFCRFLSLICTNSRINFPWTIGRFKKYFFSQIITIIHLFVAPVAKKSPQKFLSQILSGKPLRMATPFFGSPIQVKFRKMAFLARSFHFMFLEPCSFNINGRKAFCLFWVSKQYGNAQPVFWPHPIFYR